MGGIEHPLRHSDHQINLVTNESGHPYVTFWSTIIDFNKLYETNGHMGSFFDLSPGRDKVFFPLSSCKIVNF